METEAIENLEELLGILNAFKNKGSDTLLDMEKSLQNYFTDAGPPTQFKTECPVCQEPISDNLEPEKTFRDWADQRDSGGSVDLQEFRYWLEKESTRVFAEIITTMKVQESGVEQLTDKLPELQEVQRKLEVVTDCLRKIMAVLEAFQQVENYTDKSLEDQNLILTHVINQIYDELGELKQANIF